MTNSSSPKFSKLILTLVAAFSALNVHAIGISDAKFMSLGGDINNINNTFMTAYAKLAEKSKEDKFLAAGALINYSTTEFGVGGSATCTASWLGNSDPDSRGQVWSYLLTAAHCVGKTMTHNNEKPQIETEMEAEFRDYNQNIIAKGRGVYIALADSFVKIPGTDYISPATDIAIVKLPKVKDILNKNGQPISPPLIYNGNADLGQPVDLVGYGQWYIGWGGNRNFLNPPSSISQRAWGRGTIASQPVGPDDKALGLLYDPNVDESQNKWAQLGHGDSGGSWWMTLPSGQLAIISLTRGVQISPWGGQSGDGVRVSKYAAQIKAIFPAAKFSDGKESTFTGSGNNPFQPQPPVTPKPPVTVIPKPPVTVIPKPPVTVIPKPPVTVIPKPPVTVIPKPPVTAPPTVTNMQCYWMENYSGKYNWVPFKYADKGQCYQLDSCDGGKGLSGGGCYKWAAGPNAARQPW